MSPSGRTTSGARRWASEASARPPRKSWRAGAGGAPPAGGAAGGGAGCRARGEGPGGGLVKAGGAGEGAGGALVEAGVAGLADALQVGVAEKRQSRDIVRVGPELALQRGDALGGRRLPGGGDVEVGLAQDGRGRVGAAQRAEGEQRGDEGHGAQEREAGEGDGAGEGHVCRKKDSRRARDSAPRALRGNCRRPTAGPGSGRGWARRA